MQRRQLMFGGITFFGAGTIGALITCGSDDDRGQPGDGPSQQGATLGSPPPGCFDVLTLTEVQTALGHLASAQRLIEVYDLAADLWANRDAIMAIIDSLRAESFKPLAEFLQAALVDFAQDWALLYLKRDILTPAQAALLDQLTAAAGCAMDLPKCVVQYVWTEFIKKQVEQELHLNSLRKAFEAFRTVSKNLEAAIKAKDRELLVEHLNEAILAFERIIAVTHSSVFQLNKPRKLLGGESVYRFFKDLAGQSFVDVYDGYKHAVLDLSKVLEEDINALGDLERACDDDILCGSPTLETLRDGRPLPNDWPRFRCSEIKGRDAGDVKKRCFGVGAYASETQKNAGQGCPGATMLCCEPNFRTSPPRYHIE